MKKLLSNKYFYIALSLILFGIFTFSLNLGKHDKIEHVELEYFDNKVYIEVYLLESMDCKDIKEELNVKEFTSKGRIFFPTCAKVDDHLTKIIYAENYKV